MWRFLIFLSIKFILLKRAICFPHNQQCQSDNSTMAIYVLDKESLPLLSKDMEILNGSVEILKQQMNLINLRLDKQMEVLSKFSATSSQPTPTYNDSKEEPVTPLIDIRFEKNTEDESYQKETRSACPTRKYPTNCLEATMKVKRSGIHTIQVDLFSSKAFLVSCNAETQDGGWAVIQRRRDGSVDFFRDWAEYKIGFGNLEGEFFIGLDKLHAMTTQEPQELLIVMTDFENEMKFAKYESFAVGDESEGYALKVVGAFSGDAGDSLTASHAGYKFTTKDRKNDVNSANCAEVFKGAWWYSKCHQSNLNGLYLRGEYDKDKYAQGVNWFTWRGHHYSLKSVEMLIRPKKT